jgi:hypothetical protein
MMADPAGAHSSENLHVASPVATFRQHGAISAISPGWQKKQWRPTRLVCL